MELGLYGLCKWIFSFSIISVLVCWQFIWDDYIWCIFCSVVANCCSVVEFFAKIFQASCLKRNEGQFKVQGNICVSFINSRPVLHVADPDLIKEMLAPKQSKLTGDQIKKVNYAFGHNIYADSVPNEKDENWERVRSQVYMVFTPGKFRRTAHIMDACCHNLSLLLLSKAKDKDFINVKKLFDDFSMNVIFYTIFGLPSVKSTRSLEAEYVTQAFELLKRNSRTASCSEKKVACPKQAIIGAGFKSEKDVPKFEELISRIIDIRKETKQVKLDMLQLLIETFIPNETCNKKTEMYSSKDRKDKDKTSDLLVAVMPITAISQCIISFMDGYHVTSSVLSLVTYHLALNPLCQQQLIKEIRETLDAERKIHFDSVSKMEYLDHVISETLRLYPPVKSLQRFAPQNSPLGQTGLIIAQDSEINIPLDAIHRNSIHYPDSHEFHPERFEAKERSQRHPYAFAPFGIGKRNCLGMKFALMSMKLCVANVLTHVRFTKAAQTKIPVEFCRGSNLQEPKEVNLRIEEA